MVIELLFNYRGYHALDWRLGYSMSSLDTSVAFSKSEIIIRSGRLRSQAFRGT